MITTEVKSFASVICFFALAAFVPSCVDRASTTPWLEKHADGIVRDENGEVVSATLHGQSIFDEDIAQLASFPKLEYLAVGSPNLTKTAYQSIANLPSVRMLILEKECNVNDEILGEFEDMKELQELVVFRGDFKGSHGTHLSRLIHLKKLHLEYCRLDSDVVAALERLQKIESLSLQGCIGVDDKAIAVVGQLKQLKMLKLNGTAITGEVFGSLPTDGAIESLLCADCDVDDADLDALAKIKSLRYLAVPFTNVTSERVLRFQRECPWVTTVLSEHVSDNAVAPEPQMDFAPKDE